ncbi:MAG: WD40 repeat domain-containing protein [Thermoanaerobaculales bacterium]
MIFPRTAVLAAITLCLSSMGLAQFTQKGTKLVGTGAVGTAQQGASVAISADGNTAIVGGFGDDSTAGATWVYTRSGGVWSQQGNKLVGSGAAGAAWQMGAAISADGNTALICGAGDNSKAGAVWVFTRSGVVWSQQGSKLVGTGAVGTAVQQGYSAAISGDGSTAIVGGGGDNSNVGAVWVYTRSGGVWSQQGNKLVGTAAVGPALQGVSVAISADGNTAIVGGYRDNSNAGAAWVYTRSGGVWSQQGSKLVGTGAVGAANQGISVAISADGNTAIVGGYTDNSGVGAEWVFTRSGGVWSQQGNKLVGTGAVGTAGQGWSVTISADGNTAIVGGLLDNSKAGAVWVFTRSGGVWSQQGNKLVGTGAVGTAEQGSSVAISADGNTAIVGGWSDNSYAGAAWVFAAPYTYVAWVPVASHNGGINNSQWRSDLGLLNAATATATAQVKFFGSSGVVGSTTYVSPLVQSILTDVVGQLPASGSGAIEVISDQPIRVTARTYNQVSSTASCYPNGAQGQDYPALATADGLSATQSAYLAGLVENTATYRCNIGLVNTGTANAMVLVELFSGDGTKLGEYPVSLTPGQWAQETQPFFSKAEQTAMDRGYAKITVQTGSGVFGFASLINNITNDPTTVTMQR